MGRQGHGRTQGLQHQEDFPSKLRDAAFIRVGSGSSETPGGTLELTHLLLGSLPCSVPAAPLLGVLAKLRRATGEEGRGGDGAEVPSGFPVAPSELTAHSTDPTCAPHPSPAPSFL